MTRSIAEILASLEERFPGPPCDEVVRQQGTPFYRDHWVKRWPATLPLPARLEGGVRGYVTRQDVFDRAATVQTEADAIDLFVLMASWGTGTSAIGVARCALVLHESNAAAALLNSYHAIRNGDPVTAFGQLRQGGPDRITHFGPSYFTKWLYFSAYDTWPESAGPAPLILDSRVAASLGWRDPDASMLAQTYGDYLNIALELREAWCPHSSLHIVEYALFIASPGTRPSESAVVQRA